MGKAVRAKIGKALVKKGTGITKPTPAQKLEELTKIISSEPVSRGKRKRAIKKARLEARKGFVAAALRTKQITDATRSFGSALGDFSEMSKAVFEDAHDVDTPKPVAPLKERKSKWMKGALKRNEKLKADAVDVHRFQTLMGIPEFASDPMAAIEKHLLNAKKKREEKQALESRKTSAMDV